MTHKRKSKCCPCGWDLNLEVVKRLLYLISRATSMTLLALDLQSASICAIGIHGAASEAIKAQHR